MDDLRERMERLARRVDTAAAPDLEQVRERHTRRRRTSGLTVGIALAAIVGLLAIQIARTDRPVPTPPASGEAGAPMVWPRDDVDAQWRSDPEQLLQRFASLVLGWSDPEIVSGGAPQTYEMRPEVCPPNAFCSPGLTLTVQETEGVWSVSSVSHPQLSIDVGLADPPVALEGGSSVAFDLELPDNVSAHVGLVASSDCRDATAYEVGLGSGRFELQLPASEPDDPACDDMGAGYLFVYATDDTTVPVGDPFLEAAGIEYPWIAAVPIYLQMKESDTTGTAPVAIDGPDVLTVSCYGDQVTTVGDTVLTQADGVHLLIEGQNAYVEVSIDDDLKRIENAPTGLVLPLEPGTHTIECVLPGADQVSDPQPFEVLDPEGYWVDPSSLCAIGAVADFEPITVSEDGPFASAVLGLVGLTEGSFEAVGYGRSAQERIFVVFDVEDRPDGIVWFEADPAGTWTSTGLATCV